MCDGVAGCSHIRAHMLQQEAATVPQTGSAPGGSYLLGRFENRFTRRNVYSLPLMRTVTRLWPGIEKCDLEGMGLGSSAGSSN